MLDLLGFAAGAVFDLLDLLGFAAGAVFDLLDLFGFAAGAVFDLPAPDFFVGLAFDAFGAFFLPADAFLFFAVLLVAGISWSLLLRKEAEKYHIPLFSVNTAGHGAGTPPAGVDSAPQTGSDFPAGPGFDPVG